MHRQRLLLSVPLLAAWTVVLPAQAQVSTFSAGYLTPENINVAPASFGAYGGEYFINDAGRNDPTQSQIYTLPATGGTPTAFASNLPGLSVGALFLPSTGWGSNSGQYLTVGPSDVNGTSGQIFTYTANGNRTTFYVSPNGTFNAFAQAAIAPSTFGANAGKLIVSDEFNGLYAFDSSAKMTTITGTNGILPFALTFAPTGFGAFGETVFTDDVAGGAIESIDANGQVTTFTTVALQGGQTGLRQIAFAPSGFLPGLEEPLLFVSVSGSQLGGGTLGDIVAYDANGNVVASLRTDLGLTSFDPRGLTFLKDGNLLVSDASDPILLLTPSAFRVVPEPDSVALFVGVGLSWAGFLVRRRKNVGKAA